MGRLRGLTVSLLMLYLSLAQAVVAAGPNIDSNSKLLTKYAKDTQNKRLENFACKEKNNDELILKFKSQAIPQLKARTITNLLNTSTNLTDEEVENFLRTKHKHKIKKIKKLFPDLKIPITQLNHKELARLSKLKSLRSKYQLDNVFVVKLNSVDCSEQRKILSELTRDRELEYVEPNIEIKINANDYFLNSKGKAWTLPYSESWALEQIEAEKAWEQSKGEGVVVAVVDTGVDYNHPDLWNNIWVNPALIKDSNNDGKINLDDVDLNHNKNIDVNETLPGLFGKDFVNNDNAPLDDSGHGTHVAGTIAALADNTIGVAGIAPEAKILPIKILDRYGSGSLTTIALGIQYLIDLYLTNPNIESLITNNSYGGNGTSNLLEDVFQQAKEAGIISVVAAGNSNVDVEESSTIPASYDSVITVASSTYNKARSGFSNYGLAIDIAAPGGGDINDPNIANILSTISLDSELLKTRAQYKITDPYSSPYFYARLAGTSMATPHVVGVAALIKAKHPEYNPDEIQGILVNSAVEFPQKPTMFIGTGIVNAKSALSIDSSYPIAKLAKLDNLISGIYPIFYTANKAPHGADLDTIELAWSIDLIDWHIIKDSNFDSTLVNNSKIFFRLRVTDILGQTSTDIKSTKVENFKLNYPLAGDITNAYDSLIVRASFKTNEIKNFKVLYKTKTDANWHEEAVILEQSKIGEIFEDEGIARLDINKLKADEIYSIKLLIEYNQGNFIETEPVNFYIDSKLKKGFPIYFKNKLDIPLTSGLDPLLINLDDDLEKEIVAFAPNLDIKANDYSYILKAWNLDGIQLWDKKFSFASNLIGLDIDKDSKDEIFFNTSLSGSALIHSLNANGEERLNFPIVINEAYLNTIKIADIDNDKDLEIITMLDNYKTTKSSLLIIDAKTGAIERNTIMEAKPSEHSFVLANLDSDSDLELVYHIGEFSYTKLTAVNFDASPVAGWPVNIDANVITLENIEVCDLDNDGFDEIISKAGSIFTRSLGSMSYYGRSILFDHNGNLVKLINDGAEGTFSFTDIDANGEKDILFTTNNSGFNLGRIFALDKKGNNLDGWPFDVLAQTLRRPNFENKIEALIIKDINSDKNDDLIFSFAGFGKAFYSDSNLNDSAGIFALNKEHDFLDLNSRVDTNSLALGSTGSLNSYGAKMETSAGLPVITDIENNGLMDIVIAKDYEYSFENQVKLNNFDSFIKSGTLIYAWEIDANKNQPSLLPNPEPSPSPSPLPPPAQAPVPTNPSPAPSPPSPPSVPIPTPVPEPIPEEPSSEEPSAPEEPEPVPSPVISASFIRIEKKSSISEANIRTWYFKKAVETKGKELNLSIELDNKYKSIIRFSKNTSFKINAEINQFLLKIQTVKKAKIKKYFPEEQSLVIPISIKDDDSGYIDEQVIEINLI